MVNSNTGAAAPAGESAGVFDHLARLIEQTKDMGYDPSQMDGAWTCGDHGNAECSEGDCAALPWPEPNSDQVLGAFTEWATCEFLRVVKPYDDGKVPEMPDEAFRSYALREWPIGDVLERLSSPGNS